MAHQKERELLNCASVMCGELSATTAGAILKQEQCVGILDTSLSVCVSNSEIGRYDLEAYRRIEVIPN